MVDTTGHRISLGHQVDISMVAKLHEQLVAALNSTQTPLLDGTETERVDAAGIQLLTAFRLEAQRQGREYRWDHRPECLEEAETLLGIETA